MVRHVLQMSMVCPQNQSDSSILLERWVCNCRVLVGRQAWIAMALSVATAIALQEVVSMQYPPGKAFIPGPAPFLFDVLNHAQSAFASSMDWHGCK